MNLATDLDLLQQLVQGGDSCHHSRASRVDRKLGSPQGALLYDAPGAQRQGGGPEHSTPLQGDVRNASEVNPGLHNSTRPRSGALWEVQEPDVQGHTGVIPELEYPRGGSQSLM